MPSNTHTEHTNAATNGSSSKTSLLWAYQLRREHVHLVDRIDGLNLQLVSCANKSETCAQDVSNLDSLVKSLQAENYTLKNEVTMMHTKLAAKIEDINQRLAIVASDGIVKDATKQLEVDLRGMGVQVSELSKSMVELKTEIAYVASQKRGQDISQPIDPESKQDSSELPKIESKSPQNETRPKCVVRLKYTKKGLTRQSAEPLTEVVEAPDSIIDQATLSTLTDIPDSMPQNLTSEYDAIFQKIQQDDRTINDYLAFASMLRSELPRRKQEGHMVEAYFDGITEDDAFKSALEEYLDKYGWIWKNLEIFCKPRALRNKRKPSGVYKV